MADVTRRLRAVVCDDDPMARQLVTMVLDECDVEMIGECDTADSVIGLAEQASPDVIILDIALPGRSGLDAIPTLREVAPDSHIVVVSAFDTRQVALDAGAYDVVDKRALTDLKGTIQSIRRGAAAD